MHLLLTNIEEAILNFQQQLCKQSNFKKKKKKLS